MRKAIIGHRGHPYAFHENTLQSFESAMKNGADYIEFDVRRTADNQLIAFHDPAVTIGDTMVPIKDLTKKELDRFASTQSYSVPLIEEIFLLFSEQIAFDIELKEEQCECEVISMIDKYNVRNGLFFTSFNADILTVLKQHDQSIKTGFLFETVPMMQKCKTLTVDYLCPEQTLYLNHRQFFADAAAS
jgi:glycerophosphoryl diester phosphodiesterase